jgi:cystathionine gamma-lyase
MRFDTRAIHEAQPPDPTTGAVNAPIHLSSTFAQRAPGHDRGFVYGRSGNPTRQTLERVLASLEGGRVGLAFSSGLGAFATLLEAFGSGQRVIAGDDLYGGSWRLFEHHRKQFGLDVDYVDLTSTAELRRALGERRTALVYFETPTNPLMRVSDIRAVSAAAHRAKALVAVDNTFASPALQQPLALGADVVLHSTTKYLGGHSDVIGGALVARSRSLGERLKWLQNAVGAVPSPFDCFLVLRGIHTLGLRMRAHGASARAVVAELKRSGKVRSTHYPGDPSHPQFRLARRQMSGFGGMLSADLGTERRADRFVRGLRVFTLAESLGGVESLVDHPASMTHASVPAEVRRRHGVTDGLVRFSCGIEDPIDLAEDVRQALRGA